MKKKLVTALVLASLFSGVSAVYADYTDQEIDTKVSELKQADEAIKTEFDRKYNSLDGKVNNLTQGVQANTGKIEGIEQKQQAAENKFTSFEQENRDLKAKIGNISNELEAEKNARGQLENKLSNNIEGVRNALGIEKTNRETKDNELDGKISAETQARTQLDQRLSDRLDQGHDDLEKETKERKEEDTKIRGEFAKADKKLDKKITDEETARKDEDTKIRGEFAEADKKLDKKITDEATARENADKELEKKLTARDNALAGRIDKLATDTDKGLAKVSALAGLHPLDYDPSNKLNFAVAGGFYNGENAVALGAFYRPNRNIMLSFGSSLAGGENAYNVGLSIKVGKGGDRMDESSTTVSELYALVGRMQEEMMAQRNQIAEQQRKIEELEAR